MDPHIYLIVRFMPSSLTLTPCTNTVTMSISVQTSPLCLRNTTAQLSSIFLAPNSLPTFPAILQISKFSTTTALSARQKPHKKRRHGNPHRGESALRRTGLRYPVGMSKEPLPQPVLDPKRRSKIEGDPNHGLWGFFNSKKKLFTPIKEESAFGMK